MRITALRARSLPRKTRLKVVHENMSCSYTMSKISQDIVANLCDDIKVVFNVDVRATALGNARKLAAWLRGGYLRTLEV